MYKIDFFIVRYSKDSSHRVVKTYFVGRIAQFAIAAPKYILNINSNNVVNNIYSQGYRAAVDAFRLNNESIQRALLDSGAASVGSVNILPSAHNALPTIAPPDAVYNGSGAVVSLVVSEGIRVSLTVFAFGFCLYRGYRLLHPSQSVIQQAEMTSKLVDTTLTAEQLRFFEFMVQNPLISGVSFLCLLVTLIQVLNFVVFVMPKMYKFLKNANNTNSSGPKKIS